MSRFVHRLNTLLNQNPFFLSFSGGFCASLGISQYCPHLNVPFFIALPSSSGSTSKRVAIKNAGLTLVAFDIKEPLLKVN